jgi:hypothetical protein
MKVDRALDTGSRIMFAQLHLVIFGVLLVEWQLGDHEGDLAAQAIISLVDCLSSLK